MLSLILATTLIAQAPEPCYMRVKQSDQTEVTNCPTVTGNFQNENWAVILRSYQPGKFSYEGSNLFTGRFITLFTDKLEGNVERYQYRYENQGTTYLISYRPSDPDFIRLQVFENGKETVNEILKRRDDY